MAEAVVGWMSMRDLVGGLEVLEDARGAQGVIYFFFDAWIQASKEITLIDDRGGCGYYC